jgi:hypothetical protein
LEGRDIGKANLRVFQRVDVYLINSACELLSQSFVDVRKDVPCVEQGLVVTDHCLGLGGRSAERNDWGGS